VPPSTALQFEQPFTGSVERCGTFGEVETNVAMFRSMKEDRAGHRGHPDLFHHPAGEFDVVRVTKGGDVEHHEIRALRLSVFQPGAIEIAEKNGPALGILIGQPGVVAIRQIESGNDGVLQWSSGTDGEKVVDLAALGDKGGIGENVAEAPAGDREGFDSELHITVRSAMPGRADR
jgi:hypothetical protein